MRRQLAILSLALAAVACSSAPPRPQGVSKPEVGVELLNPLFFNSTGSTNVALAVDVTNTGSVPIVVRAVRVTSPGMVEYVLRSEERMFVQSIEPGETGTFEIQTLAALTAATTRARNITEPLSVRVWVDYEAGGRRFRDLFNVLNIAR